MIKQNNKSSLFLMELIISILFFALSSAICIQVFMKARSINSESIHRSAASLIASNIAEIYKSDQLSQYYHIEDHMIFFDEHHNQTSSHSSPYKAKLKESDNVLYITIFFENKEIYSLECKHYKQRILDKDVI